MLPSGLTLASGAKADSATLAAAAATATLQTEFPATGIGGQLRDAAALLRMRQSFGFNRPIFTAAISGFRPGQPEVNNGLMAELSGALAAFYRATVELQIAKQVTTFTDADFGARGTEGRAEIVLGGSVRGGRTFAGGAGVTPYESYSGTLSRWPGPVSRKPMGFLE